MFMEECSIKNKVNLKKWSIKNWHFSWLLNIHIEKFEVFIVTQIGLEKKVSSATPLIKFTFLRLFLFFISLAVVSIRRPAGDRLKQTSVIRIGYCLSFDFEESTLQLNKMISLFIDFFHSIDMGLKTQNTPSAFPASSKSFMLFSMIFAPFSLVESLCKLFLIVFHEMIPCLNFMVSIVFN